MENYCQNRFNRVIQSKHHEYITPPVTDEELKSTIVPDQSINNPVFFNEAGFIANEIGRLLKLVESGDMSSQQLLNSVLDSHASTSYLPSDMSERDAFDSTPSRYAQDPVELVDQAGYMSSRFDNLPENISDSSDDLTNQSSEDVNSSDS